MRSLLGRFKQAWNRENKIKTLRLRASFDKNF